MIISSALTYAKVRGRETEEMKYSPQNTVGGGFVRLFVCLFL